MKFHKQEIEDVFLITPEIFEDDRGFFNRSFCEKELKKYGIEFSVKQGNISENLKRGTLRGFHYQSSPSNENKILSCICGAIFNVIIDLRENSTTYLTSTCIEVDSRNKESILVPAGCANAFLTKYDNTIVHYYMGDFFQKDTYCGIRYNDPFFNIHWPFEPSIISQRDLSFEDFKI